MHKENDAKEMWLLWGHTICDTAWTAFKTFAKTQSFTSEQQEFTVCSQGILIYRC